MSKNSFAIFNVLEETKLTQNTGVIALGTHQNILKSFDYL